MIEQAVSAHTRMPFHGCSASLQWVAYHYLYIVHMRSERNSVGFICRALSPFSQLPKVQRCRGHQSKTILNLSKLQRFEKKSDKSTPLGLHFGADLCTMQSNTNLNEFCNLPLTSLIKFLPCKFLRFYTNSMATWKTDRPHPFWSDLLLSDL